MTYILYSLRSNECDINILRQALEQTAAKRGSADALRDYKEIIKSVSESETIQKFWDKYRQDFSYAADITFETVCDTIIKIMDKIKF